MENAEKLAFIETYQKKYGSIEGVCKELPFADVYLLANDVSNALTADVPNFFHLDQTFGSGASIQWIFSHLKNLFTSSGILREKIANEQIEALARIITANYYTMSLTEFMLFESRFLGGKYEKFYGETSYIMAITRSLNQFCKDLNDIYEQIERNKPKPVDPILELSHKAESHWWRCQEYLVENCQDDAGKELFGRISFIRYSREDRSMLLSMTVQDYDLIMGQYNGYFIEAIKKYFPRTLVQCVHPEYQTITNNNN